MFSWLFKCTQNKRNSYCNEIRYHSPNSCSSGLCFILLLFGMSNYVKIIQHAQNFNCYNKCWYIIFVKSRYTYSRLIVSVGKSSGQMVQLIVHIFHGEACISIMNWKIQNFFVLHKCLYF